MTYDDAFFAENLTESEAAARLVMPWVLQKLGPVGRVIDVGCASGAWLAVAHQFGCAVHGVDGYAPEDRLLIHPGDFERRDLSAGVDCSGYGLAMSLEVGEHLDAGSAEALVAGLCKAPQVLFSAALPGQGGLNHINEQWSTWWAALFLKRGYVGSCDVRWRFWSDDRVEGYYRQNLTVYAPRERLEEVGMKPGVIDVVHPHVFTYKMAHR